MADDLGKIDPTKPDSLSEDQKRALIVLLTYEGNRAEGEVFDKNKKGPFVVKVQDEANPNQEKEVQFRITHSLIAVEKLKHAGEFKYVVLPEKGDLGEGAFGRVVKSEGVLNISRENNTLTFIKRGKFAIKRFNPYVSKKEIETEADIGKDIEHLRTHKPVSGYMLMRRVKGASLREVLGVEGKKRTGKYEAGIPASMRGTAIGEVVNITVDQSQTLNLVHQDIKPENIQFRIKENDQLEAKLIDYGIAHKLSETKFEPTGTREYMAPEILVALYSENEEKKKVSPDPRSDVYSAAMVAAEIIRPGFVQKMSEFKKSGRMRMESFEAAAENVVTQEQTFLEENCFNKKAWKDFFREMPADLSESTQKEIINWLKDGLKRNKEDRFTPEKMKQGWDSIEKMIADEKPMANKIGSQRRMDAIMPEEIKEDMKYFEKRKAKEIVKAKPAKSDNLEQQTGRFKELREKVSEEALSKEGPKVQIGRKPSVPQSTWARGATHGPAPTTSQFFTHTSRNNQNNGKRKNENEKEVRPSEQKIPRKQ